MAEHDPNAGGGDGETPPVFTTEQSQEMVRVQNAAISAHSTRMQKVVDQKLNEMKETFSSMLNEAVDRLAPKPPEKNGKGNGKSTEADAIKAEYEARIAQIEKRADDAERRRAEEAEKAKVAEERQKLNAALGAAGVDKGRIRAAIALLYTEDKRIDRDDSGNVVFKMQRDGYVDDLDLADGIAEWLKSDEGKHFAPPMGARGSGAERGRAGAIAPGKKTLREKKAALVRAVLEAESKGSIS